MEAPAVDAKITTLQVTNQTNSLYMSVFPFFVFDLYSALPSRCAGPGDV